MVALVAGMMVVPQRVRAAFAERRYKNAIRRLRRKAA
jgi:hypothetical protein